VHGVNRLFALSEVFFRGGISQLEFPRKDKGFLGLAAFVRHLGFSESRQSSPIWLSSKAKALNPKFNVFRILMAKI